MREENGISVRGKNSCVFDLNGTKRSIIEISVWFIGLLYLYFLFYTSKLMVKRQSKKTIRDKKKTKLGKTNSTVEYAHR